MNGVPTKYFKASNGVRQCNPLAPYFFIIGMEALTCIIKEVVAKGCIDHAKVSNNVEVSHILFVDDVLIFSKSD